MQADPVGSAPEVERCQIAPRAGLTLAPEFNPVEGMWSHPKRSLANRTKHSLDQLTAL
ncbi:hypothetical protein GCM10022384_57110 [Streptomyces marokkonensis]|uniref:Transposase n=1 Tax=Streptomyces marokkonensis TaxID=324855 RepID=A0ABP7RVW1_9ACTN